MSIALMEKSEAILDSVRQSLGERIAGIISALPGRLEEVRVNNSHFGGGREVIATTFEEGRGIFHHAIPNASPYGAYMTTEEVRALERIELLPPFSWAGSDTGTLDNPVPEKPTTAMLRSMASPELAADARQQLAVQVEDLLGYTPLRKDAGAPSKLQRILAELEITAFEQKSVDEYKQKMRAHFQALAQQRDMKENAIRRIDHRDPFFIGGYVRTDVSWSMVPLSRYEKPVPEFVLNKALQIKQREPTAQFFVDELCENKRTVDPFLVVQIGSDSAAIEVWDEPEFEKTL